MARETGNPADPNDDYMYMYDPGQQSRRDWDMKLWQNQRGLDEQGYPVMRPNAPVSNFRPRVAQMGNNLDALTGNPSITDMAGGGGVQDEHVDLIADTLRKHG